MTLFPIEESGDRVSISKIPESFLPFVDIGDYTPSSMTYLDRWPLYTYAGRLTIWGHKVSAETQLKNYISYGSK